MYNLKDVVPWSIIYGELNKQHLIERKTIALNLLEYLVCQCPWSDFDEIANGKLGTFPLFCWNEIKLHLSEDEINTWFQSELARTEKQYNYEFVRSASISRKNKKMSILLKFIKS